MKSDVFKALLILTFLGTFWHIWWIFRKKKNYSFHFTTKIIKQKMSADTILIKYFLFIFAIFSKMVKSEPYLAILLFYDVNLTATVAKFPTFFSIFFFYKNVSLVHSFRRYYINCRFYKNLVQANLHIGT